MHLAWLVGAPEPVVEVAAVLEVVVPPAVPRLHFWALQASFSGGGAGHLGLQWGADGRHGRHVNWGGYDAAGRELTGTVSALPSSTGNANTRDYDWQPGRPYRLCIRPAPGGGGWRGEITDLDTGVVTDVRDLAGAGNSLASPLVWSEIFARCDDPTSAVRWSGLEVVTAGGERVGVDAVRTSYQTYADGGCDNTTAEVDGAGVLQRTNAARLVGPGAVLHLRES